MGKHDSNLHIRLPEHVKLRLGLGADAKGQKLSDYVRSVLEMHAEALAPTSRVAEASRPPLDSGQAAAVADLHRRLESVTLTGGDGRSYPGLEASPELQAQWLRHCRQRHSVLRSVDEEVLRLWVTGQRELTA